MSLPVNPYESPQPGSPGPEEPQAEYMQYSRRPATPKVIGIIALVLTILSLASQALLFLSSLALPAEIEAAQQEAIAQGGHSSTYIMAMKGFSLLMSIWLLVSGIGLLQYKRWGRMGFNIYALVGIVSALYGIYMALTQAYSTTPETASFEPMARLVGAVTCSLGMLFPILGLAFLNRRHVVASLR